MAFKVRTCRSHSSTAPLKMALVVKTPASCSETDYIDPQRGVECSSYWYIFKGLTPHRTVANQSVLSGAYLKAVFLLRSCPGDPPEHDSLDMNGCRSTKQFYFFSCTCLKSPSTNFKSTKVQLCVPFSPCSPFLLPSLCAAQRLERRPWQGGCEAVHSAKSCTEGAR